MNKKNEERRTKIAQYDWLRNYIPTPIKKIVGGFKNNVLSPFKTNIPEEQTANRVF